MTAYARMPANQGEFREVMVKISILPIRGIMTDRAIGTVFPVVLIILLVTGITVHGKALPLPVHVACLTLCFYMLAFQLERRQVVIEFCR